MILSLCYVVSIESVEKQYQALIYSLRNKKTGGGGDKKNKLTVALAGKSAQDQDAIGASKTKRVRKGYLHLCLAGYVGYIVQITLSVRRLEIYRRRNNTMDNSQATGHCLYCPGARP